MSDFLRKLAFKFFADGDTPFDINQKVKRMSDSDIASLVRSDWSNSSGPQKLQGEMIRREAARRGI